MEKRDKKTSWQSVSFFNKPVCKVLSWLEKLMTPIQKRTEKQKKFEKKFFTQNIPLDRWEAVPRILAETFRKNSKKLLHNNREKSKKTKFFSWQLVLNKQTPLEMAKAVFTILVKVSAEGFKKHVAESRKSTEKSLPSPNKIEYRKQSSGDLEGSFLKTKATNFNRTLCFFFLRNLKTLER